MRDVRFISPGGSGRDLSACAGPWEPADRATAVKAVGQSAQCPLTQRFAAVVPPAAPTGLRRAGIQARRCLRRPHKARSTQPCRRRRRHDGSDSGVSAFTNDAVCVARTKLVRRYPRRRRRRHDGSDLARSGSKTCACGVSPAARSPVHPALQMDLSRAPPGTLRGCPAPRSTPQARWSKARAIARCGGIYHSASAAGRAPGQSPAAASSERWPVGLQG